MKTKFSAKLLVHNGCIHSLNIVSRELMVFDEYGDATIDSEEWIANHFHNSYDSDSLKEVLDIENFDEDEEDEDDEDDEDDDDEDDCEDNYECYFEATLEGTVDYDGEHDETLMVTLRRWQKVPESYFTNQLGSVIAENEDDEEDIVAAATQILKKLREISSKK